MVGNFDDKVDGHVDDSVHDWNDDVEADDDNDDDNDDDDDDDCYDFGWPHSLSLSGSHPRLSKSCRTIFFRSRRAVEGQRVMAGGCI